ncbi:hypothetical protein [Pseudoalteromonas prydzensis]|uniref:hypothetical protein n=1 Tax=Pseudoalteromonas prydzensis TaxID=182141 RepID=UPI003FD4F48B
MMNKFFKNKPEYGVIGDLKKQYSFAQVIRDMLFDMFGKEVTDLAESTEFGFYIYDKNGTDVVLYLNGKTFNLSVREQGAIAVLRYSTKRQIKAASADIFNNAKQIFSSDFYNNFFVTADWEWGEITKQIKIAQLKPN